MSRNHYDDDVPSMIIVLKFKTQAHQKHLKSQINVVLNVCLNANFKIFDD